MKNVTPQEPPEVIELAQFMLFMIPDGTVAHTYRHKFKDTKEVEAVCESIGLFMTNVMNASFIEKNVATANQPITQKLLQLVDEKNSEQSN